MAPLLIPIVTMLANKGMSLLSKAIESGEDKAVEFIEEKTGIKLSEPGVEKRLGAEELAKLQIAESEHAIELMKISLANKQEDNRHEEAEIGAELGDKQSARGSSHLYELQTDIGKRIFIQTSILIPLLIIINIALIGYAKDLALGDAMISMVSTLIGIALNNAYRERQSMIEFLFGSSIGSKMKDK